MIVTSNYEDMEDILPGEEALRRFHETRIEPLHDRCRLYDHNDLKNLELRSGQWMHSSELIYKVQRLNPNVIVEQQINYPEEWGMYVDLGKLRYVSGFGKSYLREFSTIIVNERDLAEDEIRGWRTVLLRLLSLGLLDWRSVYKYFGDSEGVNSRRWQEHTRIYRQGLATQKILVNLN